MTTTTPRGRARSRLAKTGAALAVSGIILASAFASAGAAHADDSTDAAAPAEQVQVVEAAEQAEAIEATEAAEASDATDALEPSDAPEAAEAASAIEIVAPADAPSDPTDLGSPIAGLMPAALVAPVANDDQFPGSPGNVNFLVTDMYLNDSDPTATALEILDPSGQVTIDGIWVDVPVAVGFSGSRTFQYRTSGVNGTSNWATVSVVVNPAVQEPVAYEDEYAAKSGTVKTVAAPGVLVNDDTQGGVVTAVSDPAGEVVVQPNGAFTYSAPVGFVGLKTFSYQISANGMPSQWATVTMNVSLSPVPTAVDDFYATDSGVPLVVPASGVIANDSSSTAVVLNHDDTTGEIVLGTDGALYYSAPSGFVGVKKFHYVLSDNGHESAPATVTIVVGAITPGGPVAVNDKYTMDMNTTLDVNNPGLLANDSPGIVWWDGGLYSGSANIFSSGSFTYTPDVGFSGTTVINYTIRNNGITSNVATITIEVVNPAGPVTFPTDPRDPRGPLDPDPIVPEDPSDSTGSTVPTGSLAHAGVTSLWIAAPATAVVLLGSLALGFAAVRRRSARVALLG